MRRLIDKTAILNAQLARYHVLRDPMEKIACQEAIKVVNEAPEVDVEAQTRWLLRDVLTHLKRGEVDMSIAFLERYLKEEPHG